MQLRRSAGVVATRLSPTLVADDSGSTSAVVDGIKAAARSLRLMSDLVTAPRVSRRSLHDLQACDLFAEPSAAELAFWAAAAEVRDVAAGSRRKFSSRRGTTAVMFRLTPMPFRGCDARHVRSIFLE